jgi:DNA-3-methyladenine glycosylase II
MNNKLSIERKKIFESKKKEAEEFLLACDHIGPFVDAIGPCALPFNQGSYFESLVKSIGSQQLSVKAASTIIGRVADHLNGDFSPESVFAAGVDTLRLCGLSHRKIEYIQGIARQVIANKLSFSSVDNMSDQDIINMLIAQRGIGEWTAQMFLIFTLGRPDVFAPDDLGLQKGMRIVFQQKDLLIKDMESLTLKWQPYRSFACWYLWRIQEMPVGEVI